MIHNDHFFNMNYIYAFVYLLFICLFVCLFVMGEISTLINVLHTIIN